MIVVDASVVLGWCLPDEAISAPAWSLLTQRKNQGIAAPILLCYEVAGTLARVARQERLSLELSRRALTAVLTLGIDFHHSNRLLEIAHDLAVQLKQRLYDCVYIALGETLNCEVWTADERLVRAVARQVPRLHLLRELV